MNPRLILLHLLLASLTLAGVAFGADAPRKTSVADGALTGEDLAALANEVDLAAWARVTAGPDFRTIGESWVLVYSPKDEVGAARNWNQQVGQARRFAGRIGSGGSKRWLELFIKAGDAVARNDSPGFAAAVRALDQASSVSGAGLVAEVNFFTAK